MSMGPAGFISHRVIQKLLGKKVFEDSILVSAGRQHLEDAMLNRSHILNQGYACVLPAPEYMAQDKCSRGILL